jgi:hypothetical protein
MSDKDPDDTTAEEEDGQGKDNFRKDVDLINKDVYK